MEDTQKTIIQIYIAFVFSIALCFVPLISAGIMGLLLFFTMITAAYVYRFKSEKGTMMHSHMRYLIKSFWVFSLFSVIGIILFIQFADHSVLYQAIETVKNGVFLTEEQIKSIIITYKNQNFLMVWVTLTSPVVYFLYRCVKGIVLAKKRRTFDDLQGWF